MKRFVAGVALLVLPMFGSAPSAEAVGQGACTITGTITFSSRTLSTGTWNIGPAAIDCQGIVGKRGRMTGRGPFAGSGSFSALPPGDGTCLRQAGSGKVDYTIPTSDGDILISEPEEYKVAGVGTLSTPTLNGLLELTPPYNGDCLTQPATRVGFLAQVVLYRYPRELPNPGVPPGLPHP